MLIKPVMNERGEVTTSKLIVTVAVVIVLAYIGISLAPMYVKHEMMKTEVKSAVNHAEDNDIAKIRANLNDQIDNWGLVIDNDQLIIEKDENSVRIILWWEVDKVFVGFWKKNFYFDIEEAADF